MSLRPSFARFAQAAKAVPILTIHDNPYKAQKKWPPNFSDLPQTYQFNLERRYRRRSKLRYSNPSWNQNVKLTSYILCGGDSNSNFCPTEWPHWLAQRSSCMEYCSWIGSPNLGEKTSHLKVYGLRSRSVFYLTGITNVVKVRALFWESLDSIWTTSSTTQPARKDATSD